MALHKISDFDTDYQSTIQGKDIKGMGVYSQGSDDRIGTVSDILVDDQGQFRYLIVDLGFWIFGKKVLLPLGRTTIVSAADRVYTQLTKQQAEELPEYKEGTVLDYDYEERVRGVYRTSSLGASAPLDATTSYNRDTHNYAQDADLFDTSTQEDTTFRLYEERLVANKQRRKAGEVAIGKRVETETANVAIPIEKERVVVERVTPTDAGRVVSPDVTAFHEGEVAHVEIYEEVPDIRKEAVVREEVRVRKVVDQETVEAQETIRREELDVDTHGQPVVDKKNHL
ncbi:MAG: DUF2382 domain-containing protein [Calothrix sp. C42_A2020_038]|nr:DUF2382 domain-containing protein [Calothrix sp. C42_A2020_038]